MNMRKILSLAAMLALVCGAAAARAESIDDVGKKLDELYDKTTSWSAQMKSEMTVSNPAYSMKTTTVGSYEFMRRGDQYLMHTEMESQTEQQVGGEKNKMAQKMTTVSDGQFNWIHTRGNGPDQVMKQKAQPRPKGGVFENMKQMHTLKLLPDETIDGKPAWVIELTPKAEQATAGAGKSLQYFLKDNGIAAKQITFDPAGKPISTTTLSDIKTGVKFSPDRFVFKAPPGVNVVDMTQEQMTPPPMPARGGNNK